MKKIIKSPYLMILYIIPLFLIIATRLEQEVEEEIVDEKKEIKEVAKVVSAPLKEVHQKLVKNVKENEEYQKLINKIFYEDTALYKMNYRQHHMDYELLTKRVNYYKRLVSEMDVDRYIQDKTDYKLIKKDYDRLYRLKSSYDRIYKMYRKKGISRTWIYDEFERKAFSDFEKKFAKLYRTSLSYHDVNRLTQYHFKDTNVSSKINTTGFLQRVRQKRDYIESRILVYEANKKSYDKILLLYGKLRTHYVEFNHDGI